MGPALSKDKETTALKEEVYQLKKSLEETRKKY
jgi:AmiR/NasT family two-component response regulator